VHTALWPYALRNAALMHNILPTLEDGSSWLELFSSNWVGLKMAHNHTFACPVFALQNKLAAGNTIPKWLPRACLGLNLGPSPMHTRNVYLVLNLSTGLVLPQYHCRFDDFFLRLRSTVGLTLPTHLPGNNLLGLVARLTFLLRVKLKGPCRKSPFLRNILLLLKNSKM
jgi:hypothetical protein